MGRWINSHTHARTHILHMYNTHTHRGGRYEWEKNYLVQEPTVGNWFKIVDRCVYVQGEVGAVHFVLLCSLPTAAHLVAV